MKKQGEVLIVNNVSDKIQNQKSLIMGKQLKSLESIVSDSSMFKDAVIFIYNGFDCEDCIDVGYSLVRTIDSLAQRQIVYVVSTSANVGRDQSRNNYRNYVYSDEHDLIRRELKYIYTPVLLKLNSSGVISDVYFPNPNRDNENELFFIKECLIGD
jgi:hypothetical protein